VLQNIEEHDEVIEYLVEKGFGEDKARAAVELFSEDFDDAGSLFIGILASPLSLVDVAMCSALMSGLLEEAESEN
jgi:hypothetical protein